ncbi:cation-transporting P-type ATPase [Micromonospora rubida]|uniref:Cation-transporting P-type ATPase n=1 Tax=Micromonospora rubida TaxID=2697657 RepID=A0ABW7SR32_9ACTN
MHTGTRTRLDVLGEPNESGGLGSAEAAARLRADGPNSVAPPTHRHLAFRVLHQLTDPLVALLLAAWSPPHSVTGRTPRSSPWSCW